MNHYAIYLYVISIFAKNLYDLQNMRTYLSIIAFLFSIIMMPAHAAKKHELRGAWIATVANIDWPSTKGNYEKQKDEMIAMLDSLHSCNINTIFLQVRPCADALYKSEMEPWSAYLSGKQGSEVNYDPLAFTIDECHKRCMEVHAWINPYRVTNGEGVDKLSKNHLYFRRPELFLTYGGKVYFNPGLEEVRDYLTSIVMDIVLRYDVDGIHMDDYFYPYKVAGEEFPDFETFKNHHRDQYDRQAWRRDNVNLVVKMIHDAIHRAKPWVWFGVSPFGVYRNEKDDWRATKAGASCTNYDELCADVLLWLEKGWIDYAAPQLYWELGRDGLDYGVLSKWWGDWSYGRNMFVGLYASGLAVKKDKAWKEGNEVIRQLNTSYNNNKINGYIFYSAKYLRDDYRGLKTELKKDLFRYPALVPVDPMTESSPSSAPKGLKIEGDMMRWKPVVKKGGYDTRYYAIYCFSEFEDVDLNKVERIIAFTQASEVDVQEFRLPNGNYKFVVTSINKFRHESKASKPVEFEMR